MAEAPAEEPAPAATRGGGKKKGRGHKGGTDEERYDGRGGVFESVDAGGEGGPLQSVEGWILFIRNVHEEAQEDDILDKFSEAGGESYDAAFAPHPSIPSATATV